MPAGRSHIGTSGWSYKHWKGIFYPEKIKSTEWLPYYAQTFQITEINSSFYHLPKKTTVQNWVDKTPSDFLFCPKMSRYLTHLKRLREPEESLQRFFDVFEPMRGKMGPILLQLPQSVHFDEDVAIHLFEVLKNDYPQYAFALEARHPGWLTEGNLGLLSKYKIALVVAESGGRFPYIEKVTSHNIYIRFHGPNGRYNTPYDDDALQHFSERFGEWVRGGHELWIFFNNDVGGHAIRNALRLEELLKARAAK